ncbi:sugar dehydrogenase complex small subunit [Tatumella citrea]|uniref:Sorbitol dehydrogenase n=1 Tax=Tatumella citrea TaxID=53336 RepID=A0A1Y0L7F5_TATCI|nr:sugar dehydrogenase complex small subunit [Tatumella citrea]ARU93964.1 hypothetical protein A7K98_09345 [Tatumella citrea]ARU98002.1 hypothetical protein A7K99_09345 [Tatumella citrea]
MKFVIDQESDTGEISASRRSFLIKITALLASFTLIPAHAVITTPADVGASVISQLQTTAQFLTESQQDPQLIIRAANALLKVNSNFAGDLQQLSSLIADNHIANLKDLKTSNLFEGKPQQTAKDILSALYLGYAGTPVMLSSEDNVVFVAYAQARTYQLTKDFTPVPSYSRWKSGYWAHLPAGV